jgi:Fe-Mn family superoxide dismutase
MAFELKPLPYSYNELEPYIDARTVDIHYNKHHATYLKNFNTALEKHPEFFSLSIENILSDLDKIPEDIRTTVKNNGGGYYNHNLYWENMTPASNKAPEGELAKAIDTTFGSFSAFKEEFEKTGLARLGSGYVWLCRKQDGGLIVYSTPNQDSPLADKYTPILVSDVWEHAYYLNYQNRRAEYLANWWNIVNWKVANDRYIAK